MIKTNNEKDEWIEKKLFKQDPETYTQYDKNGNELEEMLSLWLPKNWTERDLAKANLHREMENLWSEIGDILDDLEMKMKISLESNIKEAQDQLDTVMNKIQDNPLWKEIK